MTRIEAPEDAQPMLHITLEMLRNSPEITATLNSTSNLRGSFPIEHPEDAKILVYREGQTEVVSNFIYDEERQVYVYQSSVGENLIVPSANLILEARVVDERLPRISAKSRVPLFNEVVDLEMLEENLVPTPAGDLWQGVIRFNMRELNTNSDQYYQLLLQERKTVRNVMDQDTSYSYLSESTSFEIIDVTAGGEAIETFEHQEGLFIDLLKLESEYIELNIASTIPFTEENQVIDHIFSSVVSLTEDHYMYHRGLSNIRTSENDIFGEPALYRSNIKGGLGIFSTCVQKSKVISLR